MQNMVFITGFARGGTSWLRDCVGSHPDIAILPRERVVFRDMKHPDDLRAYFERETAGLSNQARFIVNKAPANAPHVGRAARAFPESRFIFIIRDPRDVLVSHQRGTQAWMGGANSTVEGCMAKTQKYYEGWLDARDLPNVMLVRYEDVHQDFFSTMRRIFEFIGVDGGPDVLEEIFEANSFQARTNRSNVEDRSSARRKGVIGEWALQLKPKEIEWYHKSKFYNDFMARHGYGWTTNTYRNILSAMREAGVHFLTEDDLLARRLNPERPNVALQHDIDYLSHQWCVDSVRRTAEIDAGFGIPAGYNFLPLDDRRYQPGGKATVLPLVEHVLRSNPKSYVGLHVNACERFYPPDAPDAGAEPPELGEIIDYARRQANDYRAEGIDLRIATAHGYGRAKKLPNNRDTPQVGRALAEEGILLFDTTVRRDLMHAASHACALTDVGGVLKPRGLNNGHELTDPRAYSSLPGGSFLRFLTHPGNYSAEAPCTVAMRVFNRG